MCHIHLQPPLHLPSGPCFWSINSNTPNTVFCYFRFYFKTKVIRTQLLVFVIKHNFSFFNSFTH
jgi:hypothetical protein